MSQHRQRRSAAAELEHITGRSIFTVIRMDLTDLDSVRSALSTLDGELHSVVMNAGGTGGPTPLALTADGVTHVFGSNVLGHVVLLENLIDAGALTNTAVLVGSEAARGVRMMRMPRPTFRTTRWRSSSASSTVRSSGSGNSAVFAYGQVKYLGALWMSALARKHPGLRLLTVSPGNTAGTEALRDMGPDSGQMNHLLLPYVLPALGVGHQLEKGALRLVDGVTDEQLRSGVFYASRPGAVTGPLVDQSEIVTDFRDPGYNSMPTKPFIASRRSHAHTENRLFALSVRMARRLVPLKEGCHDKRRYHHPSRSSIPVQR